MSLQAHGGAQSPLLPPLSVRISVPPPQVAPNSNPSSTLGIDSDQPIVIEVPRAPSSVEGAEENGHVAIVEPGTERVSSHNCELQNSSTPTDALLSPSSAIKVLISSIRQNLQEVYSVLAHYPAPVADSTTNRTRRKSIKDDPVVEKLGNRDHWVCRWLGGCWTVNWQSIFPPSLDFETGDETYLYDTGDDDKRSPEDWSNDTRVISEIPQYIFDYAPLVHLFSGEQFWPCDMAEHLEHVTPDLNYTPILSRTQNLNLTNLDNLNEYNKGRFVYLTSDDNVEERPDWLGGQKNIPDTPENLQWHPSRNPHADPRTSQKQPLQGGRSDAPAVLIVVNKGHGIVDAFWFYFYSYNLGNVVLNVRFGDHVGDWEHSLVRFQHGKPKIVFFSEHFFGQAYTYDAVEKIGKRPVVYSATGTHAMYATPGLHPYILPLGLLHDQTDRGPLWDPLLNTLSYTYNPSSDTLFPPNYAALTPSNHTPHAPTNWFFYNGHWGDKLYPMDDSRQYQFAGQYHYVTGPLGPRFKHLGRRKVCQGPYSDKCVVKNWLGGEGVRVWPGHGEAEEDMNLGDEESGGGYEHDDL